MEIEIVRTFLSIKCLLDCKEYMLLFRVKVKTTELDYGSNKKKMREMRSKQRGRDFPKKKHISSRCVAQGTFFCGEISSFFPSLNCKSRLHAIWQNKKRP